MRELTVVTYNNILEPRDACVFIRGKYYHKERDCYFYNGIYYSPFSRYLVFDHETQKRVHMLSKDLSYGLVDIVDGKYILGHYSKNILKNCYLFLPSSIEKEDRKTIMKSITENNSINSSNASRNVEGLSSTRQSLTARDRAERGYRHSEIPSDYFEDDEHLNIFDENDRFVKCMDVEKFINTGMSMSINSDILCAPEDVSLYNKIMRPEFSKISAANQYDFNLAYNCEVMMETFQSAYNNHKFEVSKGAIDLAKYVKKYTFGIEYETWDGRLSTHMAVMNGLIPVRDGSLRHDNICGFEYATVIMNGAKGLAAIKSQCQQLKIFNKFNEKCSMHIHVGSILRTKENLIKLYKAFYGIQDSIYLLFPSCLRNTGAYKVKDYCSPLPALKLDENSIVNWLSDGNENFGKFGEDHPKDQGGRSKWNCHSRYSICNLNNFYYTSRGTVELRISTPTFNHNKIIALLIIMCMIIDSAVNNDKYYTEVEQLIAENSIGEFTDWLLRYVDFRKSTLSKVSIAEGSIKYFENMSNDEKTGNRRELL